MDTDIAALARFIEAQRQAGKEVVLVSGYFNCLHVGHLRYIESAAQLGQTLVVVVNNDRQVALKGSVPFMNERDRLEIVSALRWVDRAVIAIDDDRSVCRTLEVLRPSIFANGGDVRSEAECREAETCRGLGIRMVFGVGGDDKIRSSSELLRRVASPDESYASLGG